MLKSIKAMNKDTVVYLPVSVEYNPNKSGWYLCTKSKDLEGAWYGHGYFKDGEWESSEIKHWLKPLTVEALLKDYGEQLMKRLKGKKGNDVTSDSKASEPVVSLPCTDGNSIEP
jgi:hypothetical protein